MEPKKETSFLLKVAVVSAVTAILVFFLLAVIMVVVYFQFCCEPIGRGTPAGGDGVTDRTERTDRTLTGSTTDAAKITSISFSAWTHVGPLYPGPNDPPGYVESSSIEFRRGLTAVREKKKDYDRDLPDETNRWTAPLTEDQFAKLAEMCAANDIVNEPDATGNRSEAGTLLIIEYSGEKRRIVTSNTGQNSEGAANVLAAIKRLEGSAQWVSAP